MTGQTFTGSRWWKFDFHTHTPASADWGKGDQTLKGYTPRQWLMTFMAAGIDCVAVTDHNSGQWVDPLQAALSALNAEQPPGYRPLVLFPGVEISAHGNIHILAIFDPSKSTADIVRLLGAVGFQGEWGRTDRETEDTAVEVIRKIVAAGALAVPAHVDQASGLFGLSGNSLRPILEEQKFAALEVIDPSQTKPALSSEMKIQCAEVLGSDAHHPTGAAGARFPGSHFTWIKMGQPDLEGLQLALLDGAPLSVRRSDQDGGDPNRCPELMIESVEIAGGRHVGRGKPLALAFSPWLTAIVGGRGTGKSTVLEMIRIALRREDELPEDLSAGFKSFKKKPRDRKDRGMLTDETTVSLTYRKESGGRFRIGWNEQGTEPAIQEIGPDGGLARASGEVRSRFPVRLFSQKQVFSMAEDTGALLQLIDDDSAVDRAGWQSTWDAEERRFLFLRAGSRELEGELAQRERTQGALEDVLRKLEAFEQGDHAAVLADYQRRQRQQRGIEEWRERWAAAEAELHRMAEDLLPPDLDLSLFPVLGDAADQAGRTVLEQAAAALRDVANAIGNLADRSQAERTRWQHGTETATWRAAYGEAEARYQALVDRLRDQDVATPSPYVYAELLQKRQELESRLRQMDELQHRLTEMRQQADAALARLKDLRRTLSQRRHTFLHEVLRDNPHVRIRLLPLRPGAVALEAAFRQALGCGGDRLRDDTRFREDILVRENGKARGLLAELLDDTDTDDASVSQAFEDRLDRIKERLAEVASGGASGPLGGHFLNYLRRLTPEQIDRLFLWFPDDGLDVEFGGTERQGWFQSIRQGSPGQKTAAMLAFLLAYGQEPLLLDQPEDDLDNRLIYDLIVQQIRQMKVRRQVIVITHNPNIVVNGDAEQVIQLDYRGGQCVVAAEGPLQSRAIRDAVCRVMEGGLEAFRKRYQRLSPRGRDV